MVSISGGLIPAHAGSTGRAARPAAAFPAHPRSRGEHLEGEQMPQGVGGSSPLTRGARLELGYILLGAGLIPAHAGSTSCQLSKGCPRRAHPRSRGEHPSTMTPPQCKTGSSPLTRGAPAAGRSLHDDCGLIPAHAGSTSSSDSSSG